MRPVLDFFFDEHTARSLGSICSLEIHPLAAPVWRIVCTFPNPLHLSGASIGQAHPYLSKQILSTFAFHSTKSKSKDPKLDQSPRILIPPLAGKASSLVHRPSFTSAYNNYPQMDDIISCLTPGLGEFLLKVVMDLQGCSFLLLVATFFRMAIFQHLALC